MAFLGQLSPSYFDTPVGLFIYQFNPTLWADPRRMPHLDQTSKKVPQLQWNWEDARMQGLSICIYPAQKIEAEPPSLSYLIMWYQSVAMSLLPPSAFQVVNAGVTGSLVLRVLAENWATDGYRAMFQPTLKAQTFTSPLPVPKAGN